MYEIRQLDLLGSSACDLKCDYCFLKKDHTFKDYNIKLQQAWRDGTYVETVKKVFNKLNSDPKSVTCVQLWGGEPFINVKNITKSFAEIVKLFPNINSFVVPTNFYHTNIEDLCDFFEAINNSLLPQELTTREEKQVHFNFQMSIDGIDGDDFMKYGHYASWEDYKNNFDKMIDILSKKNLDKLSIDFAISGTSELQRILAKFTTYDELKTHLEFWNKVLDYVKEKVKGLENPCFLVNSQINFPNIAIPVDTTTEESLELLKTVKLMTYTAYNEDYHYTDTDRLNKDYFNVEKTHAFVWPNHECPESDQGNITLRPDGTIVQCPDAWLEDTDEYLNELFENKNNIERYKNALISRTYFFNPLTATEEEIKDHQWYIINGGMKDTYSTHYNLNMNLALEMALSRQIDFIYYQNPYLLFQHMTGASTIGECFRVSTNTTGLPYCAEPSFIRRWLNGYVEWGFNTRLQEIKDEIKEEIDKE